MAQLRLAAAQRGRSLLRIAPLGKVIVSMSVSEKEDLLIYVFLFHFMCISDIWKRVGERVFEYVCKEKKASTGPQLKHCNPSKWFQRFRLKLGATKCGEFDWTGAKQATQNTLY